MNFGNLIPVSVFFLVSLAPFSTSLLAKEDTEPIQLAADDGNASAEIEGEAQDNTAREANNHAVLVWSIVLGSIAGGFSIVGLVLWLIFRYEKKRTAALAVVANEIGLQFTPGRDERLLPILQQFRLFNQGHSRRMKNVMTAVTEQLTLTIFDYQYTTGGGNNSRTHSRTLVALESSAFQIPQFSVRPEGLGDKLAAKLGYQDIDFDEHPDFSSKFVLQSKDENAVRHFFTGQILNLFAARPDLSIDAIPGLITYWKSKRAKPEEIRDLMSEAYDFVYKLKENVT